MPLTAERLINSERYISDNVVQFVLYLPFGLCLFLCRILLALVLWISSIILPNKSPVRQFLSTLACTTFGVYVKLKGKKDPQCSVMVANYVTCLDSLAVSHVLGTISLRKWKVPPFFASTLGIKNAAQFARKQHFADSSSKPVLVQPEGGPTNGKGLLKFSEWPFPLGNRVQPVAISVERVLSNVTVHAGHSGASRDRRAAAWSAWRDAAWYMAAPVTVCRVTALPALERGADSDAAFVARIRRAIADELQIEATEYTWDDLCESIARAAAERASRRATRGAGRGLTRDVVREAVQRDARRVKDVLPLVPLQDIVRDLAVTRSVDVTITNFLEGLTPYVPEKEVTPQPGPSTSQAPPKYVTPAPTGVFPKSAKERQISFQEKKEQMIADARKRYVEKHGLNIALNNC